MFSCNSCNAGYSSHCYLQKHIQSEHFELKEKLNCTQCGKQHVRSIHEKKKYPCNLCDYQATPLA